MLLNYGSSLKRILNFDTEEAAHAAYMMKAREVFGDFARSS
jgi:hypothetical protein